MKSNSNLGQLTPEFGPAHPYIPETVIVEPHHKLLLKSQGLIKYDKETKQMIIIYAALPEYTLLDNTKVKVFKSAKEEIAIMEKSSEFILVNRY